jgi:hypothetical protein
MSEGESWLLVAEERRLSEGREGGGGAVDVVCFVSGLDEVGFEELGTDSEVGLVVVGSAAAVGLPR